MAALFQTRAEKYGLTSREMSDWSRRREQIKNWWEWFDGTKLKEEDRTLPSKDGQYPLKYPLQINPVGLAARLHSYALWGETADTSDPLVKTLCESNDKDAAEFATRLLHQIEYENDSRALDTDAGLSIQCLGGIVCKVGWENQNPLLPSGIRYEYLDPREFQGRWRGKRYFDLTEAWIWKRISREEALTYGVKAQSDEVDYVEHWDTHSFWIKVDDVVATIDGQAMQGDHGFGETPVFYVPHERANSFWGISLSDGMDGLIKELNSRYADVGDAISKGVNDSLMGRNMRGGHPVIKSLANGVEWIDTGRGTGPHDQPEFYRTNPAQLPSTTQTFVNDIQDLTRTNLITPEIAYGKEEGSQRSGQTLFQRMWPMLSHCHQERTWWTIARNRRAELTLRILANKSLLGVEEKHLRLSKRQLWAPMVPVDRAALVDEVIKRLQTDGISREHAVELFGDATDIPAELAEIKADMKLEAEIKALGSPAPQPFSGGIPSTAPV